MEIWPFTSACGSTPKRAISESKELLTGFLSRPGFLLPDSSVGSSKSLSQFATNQQYATYSAVPHQYPWLENTFTWNGEELQQSSRDWNIAEVFAETRQALGNSNLAEGLPASSFNQLPIVWNSFDQTSVSGSTGIQDVSNYATSRDAMGRTAFQCHREECHGKRFARHSELQRHEDRHNRPFICPVSSCNKKDFADRGSLQRHSREVHKSAKFFCPVPQCERNKRGFGRKYNLIGHNRRVHGGAASNLTSPVSEDACENSFVQDGQVQHSGSDGREGLVDEGDDEVESPEDMTSPLVSSKAEKLKQKLRKLRESKNEHTVAGEQLSRDIQTVERLLLDAICNEG